jgi:hypothetical protein
MIVHDPSWALTWKATELPETSSIGALIEICVVSYW